MKQSNREGGEFEGSPRNCLTMTVESGEFEGLPRISLTVKVQN